MSRIGKKPIQVPAGVAVAVAGSSVTVKGPKGELSMDVPPDMALDVSDTTVVVQRPTDSRRHRALHGLTRSLLQNMVTGVAEGFRKTLELQGVGYRASVDKGTLTINVGFSHPVAFPVPQDVAIDVKETKTITVEGIDKQRVGQVAAIIRAIKPPEPYKGTGIRYSGERILRKEGKAGAR